MADKQTACVIGMAVPSRPSDSEEMMPRKESEFNHKDVMGYDMPGIGPKDAIEDCSICVQGAPGVVTVTFSTVNGETLLILDPVWAETMADWLQVMAGKARQPEPHLSLVGGE